MIASSSRPSLPLINNISRRTVVHHARPARKPILNPPHSPKLPLPTSGTSQPYPPKLAPTSANSYRTEPRSTNLEGTNLTLHHSPPPTAPSYTFGNEPPLLKWLNGESVHLTGEEAAPRRKLRKEEIEGGLGWNNEMLDKIRELRSAGMSRSQVAAELNIHPDQQHLIARVATLGPEHVAAQAAALESQKEKWGYRKRLARESRIKRREFW